MAIQNELFVPLEQRVKRLYLAVKSKENKQLGSLKEIQAAYVGALHEKESKLSEIQGEINILKDECFKEEAPLKRREKKYNSAFFRHCTFEESDAACIEMGQVRLLCQKKLEPLEVELYDLQEEKEFIQYEICDLKRICEAQDHCIRELQTEAHRLRKALEVAQKDLADALLRNLDI
jgi:chromosome segregation ATPase